MLGARKVISVHILLALTLLLQSARLVDPLCPCLEPGVGTPEVLHALISVCFSQTCAITLME